MDNWPLKVVNITLGLKVSDAAGNESMQAGQIIVPLTSIVEGLFLPSGNQTDELISGIESSETIEEQSTPQTSVSEKTTSSETLATNAPPPISFGGDNNGAAHPSSAQAGMTSFDTGGQSNSPIANSQSNLLWGATAAAAVGAFAAETARRKAARRAANAKINQARKLKQQAYTLSQQLKKQKDAIDQALRNQAAYARVLGRKEVGIEKEFRSNLTKAQAERDALERAKQNAYDIYRKQEVAAQKKITPPKDQEKKSLAHVIVDSFGSIGDPNRNPRTAEAHNQMWAGIGAWEAIFSMRKDAKEYSTQSIKDGRWSDAFRGISILAKQNLTVAAGTVAAAGIAVWGAITTPVRIFTHDIPEFKGWKGAHGW